MNLQKLAKLEAIKIKIYQLTFEDSRTVMKLIAITSLLLLQSLIVIKCEKRFQNLENCKTSGKTTKILKCETVDGKLNVLVDNLYQHVLINVSIHIFSN